MILIVIIIIILIILILMILIIMTYSLVFFNLFTGKLTESDEGKAIILFLLFISVFFWQSWKWKLDKIFLSMAQKWSRA